MVPCHTLHLPLGCTLFLSVTACYRPLLWHRLGCTLFALSVANSRGNSLPRTKFVPRTSSCHEVRDFALGNVVSFPLYNFVEKFMRAGFVHGVVALTIMGVSLYKTWDSTVSLNPPPGAASCRVISQLKQSNHYSWQDLIFLHLPGQL